MDLEWFPLSLNPACSAMSLKFHTQLFHQIPWHTASLCSCKSCYHVGDKTLYICTHSSLLLAAAVISHSCLFNFSHPRCKRNPILQDSKSVPKGFACFHYSSSWSRQIFLYLLNRKRHLLSFKCEDSLCYLFKLHVQTRTFSHIARFSWFHLVKKSQSFVTAASLLPYILLNYKKKQPWLHLRGVKGD